LPVWIKKIFLRLCHLPIFTLNKEITPARRPGIHFTVNIVAMKVHYLAKSIFLLLSCLVLDAKQASAQFNVSITVNSGSVTTTCTDPIGAPEPSWGINIANLGWVTYPALGPCYENTPNEQFNVSYNCFVNIPPSLTVCFRAFENDPSILDLCTAIPSCLAETCMTVPVPPQGSQNFTIALPPGLPSEGQANLTITTTGIPSGINDYICNAIDIGTLQPGSEIGNADTSAFNNYCGTSTGDPDPGSFGNFWVNNSGVWFKFTTGSSPSSQIYLTAKSDPSGVGDPVNLQVGVFSSSDNSCTGSFTFLAQNHNPSNWDEFVILGCPQPNTTYYVLVDGVSDSFEEEQGYFGLEVFETGIPRAPDLRCQAEFLGAVPPDGSIATSGLRSNRCSSNAEAAPVSAFGVQRSVWFSFVPPPSGHVFVKGVSDIDIDPIGLQIAVLKSSNNTCTGSFSEVLSQYTAADLDETLELHCLDPSLTYYIMVDGALNTLNTGNFTLEVSDAGNETPVTFQNFTICNGDSLAVGASVYNQTGLYFDTLSLPGGCDSIVVTDLTVLNLIQANVQITQQGIGAGNMQGQVLANPSGGSGSYSFSWSDGQSSALAVGLSGGADYCLTISDPLGCTSDTCFTMPFNTLFVPLALTDSLSCHQDGSGKIRLSASGGIPPYDFSWQMLGGGLSGNGSIALENEEIVIGNLPAGAYTIHLSDPLFDTTLQIAVFEPEPLVATVLGLQDASCFNACDGSIEVAVTGGNGGYQLEWSSGASGSALLNLCAGSYQLSLTDVKSCQAVFDFEILQPTAFLATAQELQPVSCYLGSDGAAGVISTNGNPAAYVWSNGAQQASISSLTAGSYSVTVTNEDGCTATAAVEISQPSAPLMVTISENEPITCFQGANGSLLAIATGPGNLIQYNWSQGGGQAVAEDLPAGNYSVTVSNEKGCSAQANFVLSEPSLITAEALGSTITCFDPPDAGIITVIQATGGQQPYEYSSDGLFFADNPELEGYPAGIHTWYLRDALGCEMAFETVISGSAEIIVDAGEDQPVELGTSIQLDALVNQPGLSFSWSPAGEYLSCTDCPDPLASPVTDVLLTLTVTDSYGCSASDEVFLSVLKTRSLYVPNAFSPNGDGINDYFMIYPGKEVSRIVAFGVFDRQGNEVFRLSNHPVSGPENAWWDGSFRGRKLQPGVFAWYARIEFVDGVSEIIKGEVTLLK
jgi:gliding motility-associated-like protein